MGGTLLQQFGHDAVLLHFTHQVLRADSTEEFFIVSPAMGPRIDIWYRTPHEFTSAYDATRPNYIPEFELRINIDTEALAALDKRTRYRTRRWYRLLSSKIGTDLKDLVAVLCDNIEAETGDLPDLIGINQHGDQTRWIELKFEGFGRKSQASVLKQYKAATENGVLFYLVVPRQPLYSRKISDSWLKSKMPDDAIIYVFELLAPIVTPQSEQIRFERIQ
jgi:hypothetical protein